MRNVFQQHPNTVAKSLPISLGGTGKKTPEEAIAALGGIPLSHIGQANAPVPLDSNAKVPLNLLPPIQGTAISIFGPAQTFVDALTHYWISDWDYDTTYTASCDQGTVSMSGDEILYTAPSTPGVYHFTVNGSTYPVTVLGVYVTKPVISSPAANGISTSRKFYFSHQAQQFGPTIAPVYFNSIIEVSQSPTFETIDLTLSMVNEMYGVLDGLRPNKTYYVRSKVQYVDHNNNDVVYIESPLSDPISFRTSLHFTPRDITQFLTDPDANYYSGLAAGRYAVSMSADGKKILIGAKNGTLESNGYVPGSHLFIADPSGTYSHRQSFGLGAIASDIITGSEYYPVGTLAALSGDGLYLAIGAQISNGAGYKGLDIFIYKWDDTIQPTPQFVSSTFVTITGGADVGHFDPLTALLFNYDGSVLVAGQDGASHHASSGDVIYTFVRTGEAFSETYSHRLQQPTLASSDASTNCRFASALSLSKDGNTLVIGARDLMDSTTSTSGGAAYVVTRSADAWLLDAQLFPPVHLPHLALGYSTAISGDGLTIAVSQCNIIESGSNTTGSIYIFKKISNVWTQTDKILPPYQWGNADDKFGSYLQLDYDGNVLLVTAEYGMSYAAFNYNVGKDYSGAAFFYEYRNHTWSMLTDYNDFYLLSFGHFGQWGGMSEDGSIVALSSPKTGLFGLDNFTQPNVSIFR